MAIRRIYDREKGVWMEGEWLHIPDFLAYPERYSLTGPAPDAAQVPQTSASPVTVAPAAAPVPTKPKRAGNAAGLAKARATAAANRAARKAANGSDHVSE